MAYAIINSVLQYAPGLTWREEFLHSSLHDFIFIEKSIYYAGVYQDTELFRVLFSVTYWLTLEKLITQSVIP